jgi:glycosyltransferase involved in cell wall biosynthesis
MKMFGSHEDSLQFPIPPERISGHSSNVIVVIPTLNEETGIAKTLDGLRESLRSYDHAVVVVDGHSCDRTVEVSKSRKATVIYQKGSGYGDALFTGFLYGIRALNAKILLVMDGDGSYDPNDVPKLIDPIIRGEADFVVGRRVPESGAMSLTNRFGNWAISWMTRRLLRLPLKDSQSGMFAFRSFLVEEIDFRTKGWAVNTEILKEAAELGMVIHEVPVRYRQRLGQSKMNSFKGGLTNVAVILRMMRDTEPLLLFASLASIFLAVGIFTGGSVIIEWLRTGTETHIGTAIFSTLTTLIGVELAFFGLLADMIKHVKRKTRPRKEIFFEEA